MYSRGDPLATLRVDYAHLSATFLRNYATKELVTHLYQRLDEYVQGLWTLSLGILLDIERPTLTRMFAVSATERDAIYARLGRLYGVAPTDHSDVTTLRWPRPYRYLQAVATCPAPERVRWAAAFLGVYYDELDKAYWHGTHWRDGAGFFGYWCFELAAFVKLLGMEDTSFAAHPMYPRDLVAATP